MLSVLDEFGLAGRPLAVKAGVFNELAWWLVGQGVPVSEWPVAAYSIGVGGSGRHRPGRWDGHLVAITGLCLIDGSLDQMARPARGIALPGPEVFQLPANWNPVAGETLAFRRGDGVVVMYEPISDDRWERSVNWSASAPEIRRATTAAIARLRRPRRLGAL